MVKANFFKAIATGVILYRVFRYIGAQKRLMEAYNFNVRQFNVAGFTADGDIKFNIVFEVENRSGAAIKAGLYDFDCFVDNIKIGRAVSNDFVDIQPYSTTAVNFDVRVRPKDLGDVGSVLLDKLGSLGSINVRLVGQFSLETLPNVYKTVPVNFNDTVFNLFE
tara:strand:- start:44 stop:535 length:492 start_codon:yes stop_codon:yes gene_type:complete